jgi:hypothetical protein
MSLLEAFSLRATRSSSPLSFAGSLTVSVSPPPPQAPGDGSSPSSVAAIRIASVWPLTLDAWEFGGTRDA